MIKLSKTPFIKWSGSKRKQAPFIVSQFPKEIDTYYEPFIGGASVLHELLNQITLGNITCKHIICSDINYDLITIWNLFKNKDTREELFNYYCDLHYKLKERARIEENSDPKVWVQNCQSLYYEMRDKYNKYIDDNDTCKERSMLFYWITRTSFNGLIRYNPKNNHFNSPFHVGGRFGIKPEELQSVFNSWGILFDYFIDNGGTIEFLNKSYDEVICNATKNDLIYMDPPYENTPGMYFCNGFDTDKFWNILSKMTNENIKWLLSYDGFTGEDDHTANIPIIYKRHEYVEAGHSSFKKLNSKTRGKGNKDMVKDSLYINY